MSKATVLIVDDDDLNVEVMTAYLTEEAYHVDSVPSGERALDYITSTPPDIILMDVRMSGMSGLETTKILKANDDTHHIPVLLITALSEKKDILACINSGADDIILRPINWTLMPLRIKNLVRMKQLYDQLNA